MLLRFLLSRSATVRRLASNLCILQMTVNSSPRLPTTTSMTGHHYRRCTFCWTQRDTGWPLIFAHLELVSTLSFKTSSLRGETEIFTNIHFYCNSTDVSCLVCNNSIDPSSQSPLTRHPTIAAKDNFTSRCLACCCSYYSTPALNETAIRCSQCRKKFTHTQRPALLHTQKLRGSQPGSSTKVVEWLLGGWVSDYAEWRSAQKIDISL